MFFLGFLDVFCRFFVVFYKSVTLFEKNEISNNNIYVDIIVFKIHCQNAVIQTLTIQHQRNYFFINAMI